MSRTSILLQLRGHDPSLLVSAKSPTTASTVTALKVASIGGELAGFSASGAEAREKWPRRGVICLFSLYNSICLFILAFTLRQ